MDPRGRPRIPPALWLSLAVCLAFPPVWNGLVPHHVGEPIAIALTPPHPDDALELPPDRIEARALPVAPEARATTRRFAFALDRPGRYSLYGISSHVVSAPLLLRLDGERISTRAFDAGTGSRHRDFTRRRIAAGVELRGGEHRVALQGSHLSVRTFALELRREAPLGPARYLGLAVVAGLLLAARRWWVRTPLRPRARLVATASFAGLPAGLALLAAWWLSGPALVSTNLSDIGKLERLAELDSYLDSDLHRERGPRPSIAVLGDSTHFFGLDPRDAMRPSLERALRSRGLGELELYGIAARAFSAFDYYLLLNRLVEERPDLVVVPLNVRSFGEEWIASAAHDFTPIERYLRLDELLAAPRVRVGRREIALDRVLIRRIDHALAGSRLSLLLRGLRRTLHAELRLAAEKALPAALQPPPPPGPPPTWPREIASDHPLLAFLRAGNRLAHRHGVEILYYTVQVNLEALARNGTRLPLAELHASIEREITGTPGVHHLDLARANPGWMFSDAAEHLNGRGMRSVARRLADRIAEILSRGPRR
jgi:hypothetical protein